MEGGAIAGNYQLDTPFFLREEGKPSRVELGADGEIRVFATEGAAPQKARWWWDKAEGSVRSDARALDRRIRAYRGWTGVNLYWRLDESFDYGEEVALKRFDR